VLASPVPTHRAWSELTSSAPMDMVPWSSQIDAHLAPPSVVFHTPPSAVPTYQVLPSVASAVTRPETLRKPAPALDQYGSV